MILKNLKIKIASWALWRYIRKAFRRLPDSDKENVMEFVKRLLASRGQIARVIAVLGTALAALHALPSVTPLLGKLSEAIAAGDPTATIGAILTLLVGVAGLFDRDKADRNHVEKVELLKSK